MLKYALVAFSAALVAQPAAAADIFDYNVYASGNVHVSGGTYGDIASGSLTNNGASVSSHTASSGALDSSAQALSAQLLAMTPTGSFSYGSWDGDVRLTGSSSGVNVFNIGDAGNPTWGQLNTLTFSGPGTGAIVNVWGASLTNWVNFNLGGLAADKVIFNFHEADAVSMGGMIVPGSVLAPYSLVTLNGGGVEGAVVASALHGEGAFVGGAAFTGLPATGPAVPEPATWLMMIVGFGAIGAIMRRRKRSGESPVASLA